MEPTHRAKVTVIVTGRQVSRPLEGYTVTLYDAPGGQGSVLATQTTDVNGEAVFHLPIGEYSYQVTKECYEGPSEDLSVPSRKAVRSYTKALVPLTVRALDNAGRGHGGYLVRLFDGSGEAMGSKTTRGLGRVPFTLDALTGYQFQVERNQMRSSQYPINPLCRPAEVEYRLARVVVEVEDGAGSPVKNARVRMMRDDRRYWIHAWTRADGEAVFHVMDGNYHYDITKGAYQSEPAPLTVDPPAGGSGGVADDQTIAHTIP
jgi:hypothetical protein